MMDELNSLGGELAQCSQFGLCEFYQQFCGQVS